MKKISKFVVGVFCALLLATSAFAADTSVTANTAATTTVTTNASVFGDWVFTVGGDGATTTLANSQTAFGFNMSAARNLTLLGTRDEVGIRQSFSYASAMPQSACTPKSNNDGVFLGSTRPYADVIVYSFNLTKTIPVDVYIGGSVGIIYGNTPLTWVAAPEVGLDVWLAKNVGLDGRIDYAFNLGRGCSENILEYVIGIKFRF